MSSEPDERFRAVRDPAGKLTVVNSGLTRDEFLFNAIYTLASGGMVLSGDAITEFTEENAADLKKLLPPKGKAAVFDTNDLSIGRIHLAGEEIICVFNYEDEERQFQIPMDKPSEVIDFWSGEKLGCWNEPVHTVSLAGHSAQALWISNKVF